MEEYRNKHSLLCSLIAELQAGDLSSARSGEAAKLLVWWKEWLNSNGIPLTEED
jgi:hypothetical protein